MALRALQLELQGALLDPGTTLVDTALVAAPPLTPDERLEIYRRAYRLRLIEALKDTYTSLHQVLGDELFAELGGRFVTTHPSVHRSIRWYGRELADFLARDMPEHPILAELARFEWTLGEVFDAPDAAPVDRAALAILEPAAWAGMRVDFHPSLKRVVLEWNTAAVWRAVSDEQEPPAPARLLDPTPWLLWRQNLKSFFRSLDPIEERALTAALGGATFAEICTTMSPVLTDEEIPRHAAMLIGTWVESGIVIAAMPASP